MTNQVTQGQNRPKQQGSQPGAQAQHMQNPVDDMFHYLIEYARERPEQAALWCFGIGFILGWKLKPW